MDYIKIRIRKRTTVDGGKSIAAADKYAVPDVISDTESEASDDEEGEDCIQSMTPRSQKKFSTWSAKSRPAPTPKLFLPLPTDHVRAQMIMVNSLLRLRYRLQHRLRSKRP